MGGYTCRYTGALTPPSFAWSRLCGYPREPWPSVRSGALGFPNTCGSLCAGSSATTRWRRLRHQSRCHVRTAALLRFCPMPSALRVRAWTCASCITAFATSRLGSAEAKGYHFCFASFAWRRCGCPKWATASACHTPGRVRVKMSVQRFLFLRVDQDASGRRVSAALHRLTNLPLFAEKPDEHVTASGVPHIVGLYRLPTFLPQRAAVVEALSPQSAQVTDEGDVVVVYGSGRWSCGIP